MKQSKISRRSFLLGLGAVSAAAVLTACGGSSSTAASGSAASGSAASGSSVVYRTLDEIKASGTINIGVFSDKNPFGYVDENGEYQGYDVYFGNRLGEDLGVEINYVSTEAANRIEYLQTGKVDVILANFTVTPERAEEVDFALPYMNVALGVISPDSAVVTTLDNWNADDQMIVISGTTAETYLTKEYPDIPLQKYDSYATAKNALENGNGVAWANDNTEVIAFANQNPGYTVGIASLGSQDTIAPAVSQGNTTVLDWLNEEIQKLGEENFFHKDYEATLVDTYGIDYEDELVVEGGVAAGADASSEAASSEAASSEATNRKMVQGQAGAKPLPALFVRPIAPGTRTCYTGRKNDREGQRMKLTSAGANKMIKAWNEDLEGLLKKEEAESRTTYGINEEPLPANYDFARMQQQMDALNQKIAVLRHAVGGIWVYHRRGTGAHGNADKKEAASGTDEAGAVAGAHIPRLWQQHSGNDLPQLRCRTGGTGVPPCQ